MKMFLKKSGEVFIPMERKDLEEVRQMRDGNYSCEIKKSRNPYHHRLIFAVATATIENLPEGNPYANYSPYDFIKVVMCEIGKFKEIVKTDGGIVIVPDSLAFDEMDEEAFQPISDALFKVCARLLGVTEEELQQNYLEYL